MPVARSPAKREDDEREGTSRSAVASLNLSGRKLRRIEPLQDGLSAQTVLLNNNNIARIENLQYFEHLQQLSLANNHLVEMTGISQAQGLKVLDLSNNSIITIEGLTHLRSLEWLNMSGNSIKRIQNLEKNINLYHLDLSDNSIVKISNLRSLTKLRTLLLHGNLISSLKNITENVSTSSLVTLSLEDNEILDLNEITNLKALTSLEQLSIAGNPCLLALSNLIGFNYRPFIVFNCPKLYNLDGHRISQADRLDAEKLRGEGQLRTFSPGRHLQLVKYLTQATPMRKSKTPTPAMDSISSEQSDRWSVPVLDDKPSTQTEELALEDVPQSEFDDDQLVSESCYISITDSSVMSSYAGTDTDTVADWFISNRPSQTSTIKEPVYHDPDRQNGNVNTGLSVERSHEEEKRGFSNESDIQEAPSANQEEREADQPVMTEEEAFNLINLAATIIQCRVRGFLVRKRLDFYRYRHTNKAAALIQAVWRGYRTRTYDIKVITARNEIRTRRLTAHVNHLSRLVLKCQEEASHDKHTMAKAIKCLWSELEKQNKRYVAWLQSQQNRAAVKIQKHWRGYLVRKSHPSPQRPTMTSYQCLVTMCRDMKEQIDILKEQVEELKSKNLSDKREKDEDEPSPPKSIPAIRVIRPSVCILPELQLDPSTKEHLMKQGNFDAVLDDVDVDIEPLDIGEYDKEEDACNTTFDVEKSALDSDMNESSSCEVKEDESDMQKNNEEDENKEEKDYDEEKPALSKNDEHTDVQSDYYQQENGRHQSDGFTEEKQLPDKEQEISKEDKMDNNEAIDVLNDEKLVDDLNGHQLQTNQEVFESNSVAEVNNKGSSDSDGTTSSIPDKTTSVTVSPDKSIKEEAKNEGKYNENAKFRSDFDKMRDERSSTDELMHGNTEVGAKALEESEERATFTPSRDQAAKNYKTKSCVERLSDDNDFDSKHQANKTSKHNNIDGGDALVHHETSPSNSSQHDDTDRSETTTSPSIQADVSLSDVSQTSDSSASPTKTDSGKKKKKLLLRTTSADQASRLRALHSHGSLDSERLSSSLNFDSRLSQRSASLLKELRNEIASLTVRHVAKDETTVDTAGKIFDELAKNSDELYDSRDSHPASDSIESADIPRLESATGDWASETPHYSSETSRDQFVDSLQTTCTSDPADQNIVVQPGTLQDSPESSREVQILSENRTVEVKENESLPGDESKKQSFTMPVFDDVEASLTMEDFLEDSLDDRD